MAYLNIDRNECVGESLSKINSNASNFDARLSTLANTDTNLTTTINNLSAQLTPVGATCIFQEQQINNTAGGTSATGAWQKRTLNIEVIDTDGLGSLNLASNQFTLQAGTWLIQARVPCFRTNRTRVIIVDTAGPTYYGISNYAREGNNPSLELTAVATVTIPPGTTKTFYIDHYTERAEGGNGLGVAVGRGFTEVYTTVVCIKIR